MRVEVLGLRMNLPCRSLLSLMLVCPENETLLDPNAPLAGWGLDPIYFDDKAVDRKILDVVSDQRMEIYRMLLMLGSME